MSNLPNAVIGLILDLLPTKDVFKICSLSKNLQSAWSTISSFDFGASEYAWKYEDNSTSSEITSFLRLVDRVIASESYNLVKVHLCHISGTESTHVAKWIAAALARGVEELCVANITEKHVFQDCFSICNLTVLKLELNCDLLVPHSISFPHLKILHISSATFLDDNSTQKLFSSCPVLHDLCLMQCGWKNIQSITIAIPSLTTLTIDYTGHDGDVVICELIIFGECVSNFHCCGDLGVNILLADMLSLGDGNAVISTVTRFAEQQLEDLELALHEYNLFAGIYTVGSLKINLSTFQALLSRDEIRIQLPVFTNLAHLEFDEMYLNEKLLEFFLLNSPKLKSLVLSGGVVTEHAFGRLEEMTLEPQCLASHFSKFFMKSICGYSSDLKLINFFLQRAKVLKEVKLRCGGDLYENLGTQRGQATLWWGLV